MGQPQPLGQVPPVSGPMGAVGAQAHLSLKVWGGHESFSVQDFWQRLEGFWGCHNWGCMHHGCLMGGVGLLLTLP